MPTGVYEHKTSWNKGMKMPPEWGEARAHSFRGKNHTEEAKQKVSEANMGHAVTDEMRDKMSEAQTGRLGDKSGNWKGGITDENARDRSSTEYRTWKRSVSERGVVCTRCGSDVNLEAHHIKPWVSHKELRYEVSNGVAVCHACHKFYHALDSLDNHLKKELPGGQQNRIDCFINRLLILEKLNMPFDVRTRQTYISYWSDPTTHHLPRRIR